MVIGELDLRLDGYSGRWIPRASAAHLVSFGEWLWVGQLLCSTFFRHQASARSICDSICFGYTNWTSFKAAQFGSGLTETFAHFFHEGCGVSGFYLSQLLAFTPAMLLQNNKSYGNTGMTSSSTTASRRFEGDL